MDDKEPKEFSASEGDENGGKAHSPEETADNADNSAQDVGEEEDSFVLPGGVLPDDVIPSPAAIELQSPRSTKRLQEKESNYHSDSKDESHKTSHSLSPVGADSHSPLEAKQPQANDIELASVSSLEETEEPLAHSRSPVSSSPRQFKEEEDDELASVTSEAESRTAIPIGKHSTGGELQEYPAEDVGHNPPSPPGTIGSEPPQNSQNDSQGGSTDIEQSPVKEEPVTAAEESVIAIEGSGTTVQQREESKPEDHRSSSEITSSILQLQTGCLTLLDQVKDLSFENHDIKAEIETLKTYVQNVKRR